MELAEYLRCTDAADEHERTALEISAMVAESGFFSRYCCHGTWVSGCGTDVHPITVWKRSIDLQLDGRVPAKGRSAAFHSLMRRLKRRFPWLRGGFVRYDGSCPDIYVIWYWPKDDEGEAKA